MSNQSSFLNFENHQIQSLNINNELYLRAIQLAEALGYKNPRDAISTHVDKNDVVKRDLTDSLGRKQKVLYVNESGMYALILRSKLDSAKRFKKWVTSEVLPSIRKTGEYSIEQQPREKEKSVKVNNQIDITIQDNRLPKGVFVHQSKYNPYRAYVWDGGKSVYVGCYPTVEDAQEAQRLFLDNGIVKRLQKENRVNQFTNSEEVEQYLTEINLANQRVQSQLNALSDGLRTLLGSVNIPDMTKDIQLVDYISGVAKRRLNR